MKQFLNLIFFTLFFLQIGYANVHPLQDTLSLDKKWNTLLASKLSPDAKWVLVNKRAINPKMQSVDTLFYINIESKQKVEVSHLNGVSNHLLFNNLIAGKVNQNIVIENIASLSNGLTLGNIKKFSTKAVQDQNLLITLSNTNQIDVIKLNEKGEIDAILKIDTQVSNYFLNESKTKLVYQKQDLDKSIFVFDLQSFKNYKVNSLKQSIESLYWNTSQDVFAFRDTINRIYLVNTTNYKIRQIKLEQEKLERFEINFYSNNDVFIKYNIKSDTEIPKSQYIDIWNGNSKFLFPSNFKTKYEILYKAFLYNYQNDTLKELYRTRETDYEFIDLPNHILRHNPFEYQDFDSYFSKVKYTLIQTINLEPIFSTIQRSKQYILPCENSKYILYMDMDSVSQWKILNLQTKKTISIKSDTEYRFTPIWSEDSRFIFYVKDNYFTRLNVLKNTQEKLFKVNSQSQFTFLNSVVKGNYKKTLDTNKPILLLTSDKKESLLFKINKNTVDIVLSVKGDNISYNRSSLKNLTSKDLNTFVFTQENYSKAIDIKLWHNNKVSTLLLSDVPKEFYSWREKTTITFKDKHQKELEATLYYPKGFNETKKYPMIVYTYDLNRTDSNIFLIPTTLNSTGFNIPLLTQLGYFVFHVQTYVSEQGPGLSALECITQGVKAITQKEPSINSDKLGLIGHSFGGYKSSFVATQTNLFSAVVSGAAAHDLIGGLMYRYSNMRNMPDWFMTEVAQYNFKLSYAQNPQKYIDNSPLNQAHKTTTPMLLWTGLLDENVHWENTRKMYIALKRYKVPTIALFYKEMDHATGPDQPIEAEDLTKRTIDWFDYFLKDKKAIPWINKGIDYNDTSWSPLDDF